MAQIQKGDTFVDGQQVTGARLNQLIDSATVLPNIITDQTSITANTVASGDSVLLYDLSATALREATASDLLNSNLPITTSAITAGANSDIVVTPIDGALVTGATYTSTDGLTVRVTLNAHGLVVNQVVTISGAGTGYNGTFRITAVATNTFDYVMTTAATPATAQSCSYTRQGTLRNPEHAVISGNLYVNSDAVITGTTVQTGNVTQGGNTNIAGNLTVTGTTTQTGTVTQNGTVNITGAIQYNGTPVFGLYEINSTDISWSAVTTTVGMTTFFTSSTFTKPIDEIWIFEFILSISTSSNTSFNVSITNTAGTEYLNFYNKGGVSTNGAFKVVLNSGTAYTSETMKLKTQVGIPDSSANSTTGNKLLIYKYRTA